MAEPTKHRLISVQDAAKLLGVSEWTMYRWTGKRGRIPAYKLGRRRLVSTVDLERFLQQCREEPKPTRGAGGPGGRK
ncbi:MAG: helix-turn-helix domain-containing protein [Deltaproteobacteria bacterium]|nr:helix-turn-helix domain-containing protein [Deltaproteobacteria bacterium]